MSTQLGSSNSRCDELFCAALLHTSSACIAEGYRSDPQQSHCYGPVRESPS